MLRKCDKIDARSNLGVVGSNPDKDCPCCKIFRTAKTDDSYVLIPTKTDQNDQKCKGFDGFWRKKPEENRRFLMFESAKFSTRVVIGADFVNERCLLAIFYYRKQKVIIIIIKLI